MPIIKQRMSEKCISLDYEKEPNHLLQTIKVPKNLISLSAQLPKPTYADFKKIEDKYDKYDKSTDSTEDKYNNKNINKNVYNSKEH